ncbi:MAG: FtsX-like permease family protein [Polyangia bacterium]
MPFEWFVALRYLREGRMQTALILGAVAIGVAVVVFLSALISGLQANLIDKTLGSQAHIIVHPPDEEARVILSADAAGQLLDVRIEKPPQRLQSIANWQSVVADIARMPGVLAAAPQVSGAAFLLRGASTRSIALRGVDPDSISGVIGLAQKTRAGRYQIVGAEVMLGTDLASDFGVALGDKIRLVTASGLTDVFTVAGLFDLGSKDVNQRMVLVPLRSAQTLFDLAGGISTIELKVGDVFGAQAVATQISARTGLVADSWTKTNPQLLVALQSQESSKNVMLFFITLTVALSIASVLIVSVIQKTREIGVMRAVGTSRSRVLRIFLIQGGLVGFTGSVLGSALGAILARAFVGLFRTADGSPMFPITLTAALFIGPTLLATLVGLLAAVAPARRAARLDPAQVIRYG